MGGVTELFLPDISPEPSLSSSASSVAATPAAPTTVQQHGGNGGGGGGKAAVWGAGPSSGLFTGLGRGSRPHSPEARGGRPAGSGREAAADESPFPFNSAFGMGLSTPPPRRRVSGNGGAGDGDGAGGSSARGRGRAGGGRVWDAQEQASPGVPWSTSRRLGDAAPANSLVGSPTGRGGLFGAVSRRMAVVTTMAVVCRTPCAAQGNARKRGLPVQSSEGTASPECHGLRRLCPAPS